jgi:DNA helicase-2/ATP-dependent DNA helicase PcrA
MPTAKKLKIIEARLMDKIHELKKDRRDKIEKAVIKVNKHDFESKSFTRVLAARETSSITKKLRKFTEFNTYTLYKNLFGDKKLFYKLSRGLTLPDNIDKIIDYTNNNISDAYNIPYADGIALMYLKIRLEGYDQFSNIKQLIVDEAQDYYPMHYSILKLLFRESRFTVVGDINQAVEKKADLSIYDNIIKILNKEKYSTILLNKSYRSSYEIGKFSKKLLKEGLDTEFFKRNEEAPKIIQGNSAEEIKELILSGIADYKSENFESIAILCKSIKQATELYFSLSDKIDAKLINFTDKKDITGITIMPIYMAKGLEFDAVIVYDASEISYHSDYDKRLLYIACTRALHRLSLYYTGKITKFLK